MAFSFARRCFVPVSYETNTAIILPVAKQSEKYAKPDPHKPRN